MICYCEKWHLFDSKNNSQINWRSTISFFFKELKIEDNFVELSAIIKIVFSSSHGQASIKLGLKIIMLFWNKIKIDKTVVTRHFIKKYTSTNDLLPLSIPLTLLLLSSFRFTYKQHCEDRRKKRRKRESRIPAAWKLIGCFELNPLSASVALI